jgi:hypothetical protein
MANEINVAFIGLVGGGLTALISYVTARIAISNELRKLRFEAIKLYESKILEMRSSTYPGLYCILSDLAKKARRPPISKAIMQDALSQINDWDSKHAIFLSPHSTRVCHGFRKKLNAISESSENNFSNREVIADLIENIGIFEYALKSDIGIYGIEGSQIYKTKTVRSDKDHDAAFEEVKRHSLES